jgi:Tfp pilus assembly protein PilF
VYGKYEAALKIKPDKHETLNNWGAALSGQAKTKSGAEADALFAQACEKYDAALKIKPDKHETLKNWGIALSDQAKTKNGAEADRLFAQAYEKYGAALKIKSDEYWALNNWGAALSDQAKTKSGAEADALFAQAYEMYNAALRIRPEMPELYYNLACLAALRKDVTHCLEQLRKWRDLCPQPRKQNIDTEHDFDAVRANREFQEFGKSLPE